MTGAFRRAGPAGDGRSTIGTVAEARRARSEGLYAEAKQAVSSAANELRARAERSREMLGELTADWHRLRADLDAAERSTGPEQRDLPRRLDLLTAELAQHRAELARLDLAVRTLESCWLFLERGEVQGEEAAEPMASATQEMRLLDAREAERAGLAQEMHDGPAQGLSSALFHLEIVERALASDAAAAHDELRTLRSRLQRELDAMRDFISQLRPPLLGARPLSAALEDEAEALRRATGIEVETDLRAPDDVLSEEQAHAALRIVQEALRNAAKHGDPHRVQVSTWADSDEAGATTWNASVEDDGRGFDSDSVLRRTDRRHFGLRFMQDRAALVGAELSIGPASPAGTRIRLTMRKARR